MPRKKTTEISKPTPPKKRISGKGARAKGTRAEVEFCQIATELGLPSMRVIGSGALAGAKGDVKIGVPLKPDGTFPEADEAPAIMRGEVKNRATNPDAPYSWLSAITLGVADKDTNELPYRDLYQNRATKAVIWKRAKTPVGAIKEGRYNDAYLVIMGAKDWIELVRENVELKKLLAERDARG
jgi:hypothetical protein